MVSPTFAVLAQTPWLDERTGKVSQPWYRFLMSLVGGALGGTVTSVSMTAGSGLTVTVQQPTTQAQIAITFTSIADGSLLANISGASSAPAAVSVSNLLDHVFGATRGSVIYRTAAGWTVLGPGTSGNVLQTNGPGADPSWVTPAAASGGGDFVQGRLTLTSGNPVPSADVTGSNPMYFTPYKGNNITLWNGSAWQTITFTETTLSLISTVLLQGYDVFAYLSSGVLALEWLAWTNNTTRATALSYQDGRLCKSTDKTRRYLGSFMGTGAGLATDAGGGSVSNVGGQRFLWNMYNRVPRQLAVTDLTATWVYNSSVRQARGQSGNKVEVFIGWQESMIDATLSAICNSVSNSLRANLSGFGVDTVLAFNTFCGEYYNQTATGCTGTIVTHLKWTPSVGYHYLAWLESGSDGSTTWQGFGGAGGVLSGMSAWLEC